MPQAYRDLYEEFPEQTGSIRALQRQDEFFRWLCDEYRTVLGALGRAEVRLDPYAEVHDAYLRRRLDTLKQGIGRILDLPLPGERRPASHGDHPA